MGARQHFFKRRSDVENRLEAHVATVRPMAGRRPTGSPARTRSNGRIGGLGSSYLSLTQLALASARPPQLKAMAIGTRGAERCASLSRPLCTHSIGTG